nr:hypothetical protein [Neobacillus sp. Marseille-Q6967]
MGLYINKNKHPDVYKNQLKVTGNNQNFMKKDSLTEIIDEQQKANVSLMKALDELKGRFLEQEDVQASHRNIVSGQLNELHLNHQKQKVFEEQVILWLKSLDDKNTNLQASNKQLTSQIDEQLEWQKSMTEKFLKQEDFQAEVLSRLDKQEALTEKIFRQINHIRSILFERTNYLAEKIDEGYKLTSSYVYNLMTGSDQALTFYLLNKKQKNKT